MMYSGGVFLAFFCIFQFAVHRVHPARISAARMLGARAESDHIVSDGSTIGDPGLTLDTQRFTTWFDLHGPRLRWDPYPNQNSMVEMSVGEYFSRRLGKKSVDEITGLKLFFGPPPELQLLRVEVVGPSVRCREVSARVKELRAGQYFHKEGMDQPWSRFAAYKQGGKVISLRPKYMRREKTFVADVKLEELQSNTVIKKLACPGETSIAEMWDSIFPNMRQHFRAFDSVPESFMTAMSEIMALRPAQVMVAARDGFSRKHKTGGILEGTGGLVSTSLFEKKQQLQSIVLDGSDFRNKCLAHTVLQWKDLKEYLEAQFITAINIAKVTGLVLEFEIPAAKLEESSAMTARVNPDKPKPDSRKPRLSSVTLLGPVSVCIQEEVHASALLPGDYYTLSVLTGPWARFVSQDPLTSLQPTTSRDINGKWYLEPVIEAVLQGKLENFTFEEGLKVTSNSLSFSGLRYMKQFFLSFAPPLNSSTKVWKANCLNGVSLDDIWDFILPSVRRKFETAKVITPTFKEVMLGILETSVADLPSLAHELSEELAEVEAAKREIEESKAKAKAENDAYWERVQRIYAEKEKQRKEKQLQQVAEDIKHPDGSGEKRRNRFWGFGRLMGSSKCQSCAECQKCSHCKGKWCSPTSHKCYDRQDKDKYLDCRRL